MSRFTLGKAAMLGRLNGHSPPSISRIYTKTKVIRALKLSGTASQTEHIRLVSQIAIILNTENAMETTRPTHIHVSSDFYHDSLDLIQRFELCWKSEDPSFYSIKSKRMKLFIDLRIAMESALKSVVTYHCHSDKSGEKLVKRVENYRRHIEKLIDKALEHVPQDLHRDILKLCEELEKLPVGLRYKLDAMDFRRNNEKLYYLTIGSDDWMTNASKTITTINKFMQKKLSKESRIWTSEELSKEILEPIYKKY